MLSPCFRQKESVMEQKGPWRITFDTNPDDCNLSCIMCEDHSPYSQTQRNRINAGLRKKRMPIELIQKVIAEAKLVGLKEIIPSTMGEPLLYKNFETILNLCHEYQIKLNLTTNGTFPIKGAKAWASLIVPVTSDVKISWNGATKATQESIMRGSQWEKVLDNVKTFIAVRNEYVKNSKNKNYCRVTFQLTFLEENIHELAEIVKLAIDLGVDRVKGHHLWAHFKEIKNSDLRRSTESILKWNEAVTKTRQIAEQFLLPNGKSVLLENINPLPLDKVISSNPDLLGDCPFLDKEAWVAADGRFNPCCAPEEERRTLGDFGNLNEKTLTEIWESEAYQTLKTSYKNFSVCQKCNMRKVLVTDE